MSTIEIGVELYSWHYSQEVLFIPTSLVESTIHNSAIHWKYFRGCTFYKMHKYTWVQKRGINANFVAGSAKSLRLVQMQPTKFVT